MYAQVRVLDVFCHFAKGGQIVVAVPHVAYVRKRNFEKKEKNSFQYDTVLASKYRQNRIHYDYVYFLLKNIYIMTGYYYSDTCWVRFKQAIRIMVWYCTYGILIVRWIQNLLSRIFFYVIYGNIR